MCCKYVWEFINYFVLQIKCSTVVVFVQNKEVRPHLVPIWSYPSEIYWTRHEIWEGQDINSLSSSLTKIVCIPSTIFYLEIGYLSNKIYSKCSFGAFPHLAQFGPENKKIRYVLELFCFKFSRLCKMRKRRSL